MLRKAKLNDARKIYNLIHFWAQRGACLERSLNYIYEHTRDFTVYEENRKIVGVCALHLVGWNDLAEIKSLVVDKKYQNKGIGRSLVSVCIKEAKGLGAKSVFALTFIGPFFKKMGFRKISKDNLPHKIWSECVHCVYFPNCQEEAFVLNLK